jgi:hypothetical protein
MPQRLLHKAQVLKLLTKRNLSIQTWISHNSLKPHKEVLGRAHKGLEMNGFHEWHQHPPKEGGEAFILIPKQLAIGNLPVKTRTSDFEKRNIQNLKYSRCSQNRTLRFGKLDYPVFPASVRSEVYVSIVFHSSHLGFC